MLYTAGVLLPEFTLSLLLLQQRVPSVLQAAGCVSLLQRLLTSLDVFNRLAPGYAIEDGEDLGWPGQFGEISDCIVLASFYGVQ